MSVMIATSGGETGRHAGRARRSVRLVGALEIVCGAMLAVGAATTAARHGIPGYAIASPIVSVGRAFFACAPGVR
ncbi:MAG: hypothetical protein NVS2B8_00570 [Vulcanimicrobiaceae bacterium]